MELCVRSQDKEKLLKIDYLYLDGTYKNVIIGYCQSTFTSPKLGTYKSKLRALEVLDEIQEAKLGNFHYKCPSNVKVSNNEDTIVYEMPEE